MAYKTITKKNFDYMLVRLKQNKIIYKWEELDIPNVYEYVYKIPTKNPSCDLIVYSSIDKSNDKSRYYGTDRVKLVYRWKTKNGVLYCRIKAFNRVNKVLNNIYGYISTILQENQDLKQFQWIMGDIGNLW